MDRRRLRQFELSWIRQICGWRHDQAWQELALQRALIMQLVIALELPRRIGSVDGL